MSNAISRLRFLVVEDNPPMAILLKRLLRGLGSLRVETAPNGEEGKRLVATFKPHIVITDYKMSPMSGVDLTFWLRRDPASPAPETAVIMTSAYSEPARVLAARDAGVNEFLVKPVNIHGLYRRIMAVIEDDRPFIRSENYVGPCCRRGKNPDYAGPFRRASDKGRAGNAPGDGGDWEELAV